MATDSKLTLPGDFQAGKTYLIKGETLLAWQKALVADRVVPGPGQTETQTPQGRTISGGKGAGEAGPALPALAAFWRVYTSGTKWMLQGGQVSGGAGNESVSDIDLGTVGSEPADGRMFWVQVTGNGDLRGGILYGGFTVTSAVAGSGTSLPTGSVPTVTTAAARKFYLMLGTWSGGAFQPSTSGHLMLGYCPGGGYSVSRF